MAVDVAGVGCCDQLRGALLVMVRPFLDVHAAPRCSLRKSRRGIQIEQHEIALVGSQEIRAGHIARA
ncbi:MAG TPA: hypothetical protein VFO27_10190, partial [Bryobacteraceae bacterium]|nr:hypothetical protein [Bryobacteraceae bacterium]